MALAERYVILFPLGRGKALRRRRHRTRSASPRGLFTVLVAGDTSTHDGGHKALSSGIFCRVRSTASLLSLSILATRRRVRYVLPQKCQLALFTAMAAPPKRDRIGRLLWKNERKAMGITYICKLSSFCMCQLSARTNKEENPL